MSPLNDMLIGVQRWTPKMNVITKEVFQDELKTGKSFPIRKRKVTELASRFLKECDRCVTESSIKATLWAIMKKKRKLVTIHKYLLCLNNIF